MIRIAVLLGILVATLAACSGGDSDATPMPDATEAPGIVTATPLPPTPTPDPLGLVAPRTFGSPAELEGIENGVLFVDVETGEVEGFFTEVTDEYPNYQTSSDNRWVLWLGEDESVLYDRETDRVISAVELLDGASSMPRLRLLSGYIIVDAGELDASRRELIVRDGDLREVVRATVERPSLIDPDVGTWQSPDGVHVAWAWTNGFRILNLRTGDVRSLDEVVAPANARLIHSGDYGITVMSHVPLSGAVVDCDLVRVSWTAEIVSMATVPGCIGNWVWESPDISPDGRLGLVRRELAVQENGAMGWNPRLGALDVVDVASGTTVFRVAGATHPLGDAFLNSFWLADSSGFVVQTVDGYELVSAAGTWGDLPTPSGGWRGPPIPASTRPDLFSVGRNGTFDSTSGTLFVLPDSVFPGHAHPWGTNDKEMRVVLPHGGHDGADSQAVVAPAILRPPFDRGAYLVVRAEGSCVNLREAPSTSAPILTCARDGERMLVSAAPDPMGDTVSDKDTGESRPALVSVMWVPAADCSGFDNPNECIWVSVAAPDGQVGWALSAFLTWPGDAPGVGP